jgi:hypothetical protein
MRIERGRARHVSITGGNAKPAEAAARFRHDLLLMKALHSTDVISGARIDLDHITLVDE